MHETIRDYTELVMRAVDVDDDTAISDHDFDALLASEGKSRADFAGDCETVRIMLGSVETAVRAQIPAVLGLRDDSTGARDVEVGQFKTRPFHGNLSTR